MRIPDLTGNLTNDLLIELPSIESGSESLLISWLAPFYSVHITLHTTKDFHSGSIMITVYDLGPTDVPHSSELGLSPHVRKVM